tara:strand:- start:1032 stop:1931 length:900 start_codon:yes stop_codon:yes gene_type:complete
MNYSYRSKLFFLVIISILAVSISPLISNHLTNVGFITKSFWRMSIASSLMWILSYKLKKNYLGFWDNIKVFIAGSLLGLHFVLFYGAIDILRETGGVNQISNATVLGTLAPVFVLIIEKFIFNKKFSAITFISLGIALTGSLLIFYSDLSFNSDLFIGNLYAILCSILLSITFIISTEIRKKIDTITFSRLLYTSAAIVCFVGLLFSDDTFIDFSKNEFYMLALLGIVPTLFGHNIFYYLVGHLSPVIVSAIPLAEPIVSTLLSVIIFNLVIPTQTTIIGGLFTIFGLSFLIYSQSENQ